MTYHMSMHTANRKIGKIPVSATSPGSCPSSCPLNGAGCYAQQGVMAYYWRKVGDVTKLGESLSKFVTKIKALPPGQLWRHNQAGDLPGKGNTIDRRELAAIVDANVGRRGFTYTHKPVLDNKENSKAIADANQNGFIINLSADSISQADRLKGLNIGPVVVTLPIGAPNLSKTPAGHNVVRCPAEYKDRVTCASCRLCAIPDRKAIIGFVAHGTFRKIISRRLEGVRGLSIN